MPQVKADREAAAKKAAATRERNQKRAQSQEAGKKAAGTRQRHEAQETASQARKAAKGALSGAENSVRLAAKAIKQAGKVAASTVGAAKKRSDRK